MTACSGRVPLFRRCISFVRPQSVLAALQVPPRAQWQLAEQNGVKIVRPTAGTTTSCTPGLNLDLFSSTALLHPVLERLLVVLCPWPWPPSSATRPSVYRRLLDSPIFGFPPPPLAAEHTPPPPRHSAPRHSGSIWICSSNRSCSSTLRPPCPGRRRPRSPRTTQAGRQRPSASSKRCVSRLPLPGSRIRMLDSRFPLARPTTSHVSRLHVSPTHYPLSPHAPPTHHPRTLRTPLMSGSDPRPPDRPFRVRAGRLGPARAARPAVTHRGPRDRVFARDAGRGRRAGVVGPWQTAALSPLRSTPHTTQHEAARRRRPFPFLSQRDHSSLAATTLVETCQLGYCAHGSRVMIWGVQYITWNGIKQDRRSKVPAEGKCVCSSCIVSY